MDFNAIKKELNMIIVKELLFLYIKLQFLFISLGVSALCLNRINGLPDKELSYKENEKKIDFNLYIMFGVDFILFILVGIIASPMALDDNFDTILFVTFTVVWHVIAIAARIKLKRRIKEYGNDKKFHYSMSMYNDTIFVKTMFFLVEIG